MPSTHEIQFKEINDPLKVQIARFANLIDRNWPSAMSDEKGAQLIFHAFIKVAENTYRTIVWICAEVPDYPERRPEFVLSVAPLARTILDEIFASCFLSEAIKERSLWYHKSGWREIKERDDRERQRYGSEEKWAKVLELNSKLLENLGKLTNVTTAEIARPSLIKWWPTPGKMAQKCVDPSLADYLNFLNDWFYKQLSQEAHLSEPGLITRGYPLVLAHSGVKSEQELREHLQKVRSDCIVTTVTLMVSLLSEFQGVLRFPEAAQKLTYLWTLLGAYWKDPDDLYQRRYRMLLQASESPL